MAEMKCRFFFRLPEQVVKEHNIPTSDGYANKDDIPEDVLETIKQELTIRFMSSGGYERKVG